MINFKENIGKKVTISGFAEKVRNLQWVQFIVLRCEGKRIQITIEKSEEKRSAYLLSLSLFYPILPP